MKSFWHKPPKKNKRKKRKPKTIPAKKNQLATQIPKSTSWVPPFLVNQKTPAAEDTFIVKNPVTYKISTSPEQKDEPEQSTAPILKTEQKKIYLKEQVARKEFLKTFKRLTSGRWRSWDVWTDFLTMASCAISNAVDMVHYDEREKLYLRTIKKYSKEEQMLFPELLAHVTMALERNPEQDFLGDIYTELGLNNKEHRQYFTPYHICHLMADVTLGDLPEQVKQHGYVTINDPCCGAGATLIAVANVAKGKLEKAGLNFQDHILVVGQDIDYVVTMMCYIQLSLLGMAGYFKVGNSFTDPMTDNDDLTNYWFTPMYYFPVWRYRRIWKGITKLFEKDETETNQLYLKGETDYEN